MAVISKMQFVRAYNAWPILIKRSQERRTITYKELGDALGVHHRAVRYFLALIQDFCINARLPPLTILIINGSGLPGTGFIARDFDNIEQGLEEVYSFDWRPIANPFLDGDNAIDSEDIVKRLLTNPDESEEVYARIKERGVAQIIFRETVRAAYANKCALTGITIMDTLQACHIVPWSQATKAQRIDVRNGILMNTFHHKLFDSGFITISADYKIVLSDEYKKRKCRSNIEISLTAELEGKSISVPNKSHQRPSVANLNQHYSLMNWNKLIV